MAFGLISGSAASSGRFVPPLTVGRTGLGLSTGQFKITDTGYASYNYTLTGPASRTNNIVTLTTTPSTGTVQAVAPKGLITSSTTVNIARTPYTYHSSYHTSQPCASHWHSGQCAAWGPAHHILNGHHKNSPPANYNDSESEWWRIW